MKIEIQAAYPLKKNVWSVHAYLNDFEMDLRNIYAKKTSKGIIIFLPYSIRLDPQTNKKVKYPLVDFTNKQKKQNILQKISTELSYYLKKNKGS